MARRASTRRGKVISLYVPMPVSLARRVRTVPYPYPRQRQLRKNVIRVPLARPGGRFVFKKVRMRVPRVLPLVAASYVSMTDSGLSIHSSRQTRRLLDREFNRRRYQEHKTNRRRARHGQLESVRSDRLGMLGAAARAGFGARRMAEVAMVSRGLGGS